MSSLHLGKGQGMNTREWKIEREREKKKGAHRGQEKERNKNREMPQAFFFGQRCAINPSISVLLMQSSAKGCYSADSGGISHSLASLSACNQISWAVNQSGIKGDGQALISETCLYKDKVWTNGSRAS